MGEGVTGTAEGVLLEIEQPGGRWGPMGPATQARRIFISVRLSE